MKINRTLRTGCALVVFAALAAVLSNSGSGRTLSRTAPATVSVDLRSKIDAFHLAVRDQRNRNTCSVYAATFLLEYETAKAFNRKGLDYSEDYLNAVTDKVTGVNEDGDYFANIVNAYLKFGTVDQSDFANTDSYEPGHVPDAALLNDGQQNIRFIPIFIRENPGGENPWGLTEDHVKQIVAQHDAGRPVAAGWRLGKGGIESRSVLQQEVWSRNLAKTPTDYYGHSMAIIGYVKAADGSDGYFIIRNSGGTSWGDHGYWYCSFDFARRNIADVFYFKPKPPQMSLRLPEIVRRPIPRYIRMDELRRIMDVAARTSMKNQ